MQEKDEVSSNGDRGGGMAGSGCDEQILELFHTHVEWLDSRLERLRPKCIPLVEMDRLVASLEWLRACVPLLMSLPGTDPILVKRLARPTASRAECTPWASTTDQDKQDGTFGIQSDAPLLHAYCAIVERYGRWNTFYHPERFRLDGSYLVKADTEWANAFFLRGPDDEIIQSAPPDTVPLSTFLAVLGHCKLLILKAFLSGGSPEVEDVLSVVLRRAPNEAATRMTFAGNLLAEVCEIVNLAERQLRGIGEKADLKDDEKLPDRSFVITPSAVEITFGEEHHTFPVPKSKIDLGFNTLAHLLDSPHESPPLDVEESRLAWPEFVVALRGVLNWDDEDHVEPAGDEEDAINAGGKGTGEVYSGGFSHHDTIFEGNVRDKDALIAKMKVKKSIDELKKSIEKLKERMAGEPALRGDLELEEQKLQEVTKIFEAYTPARSAKYAVNKKIGARIDRVIDRIREAPMPGLADHLDRSIIGIQTGSPRYSPDPVVKWNVTKVI